MKGNPSNKNLIVGCTMMSPLVVFCWYYIQYLTHERFEEHVLVDFFISMYFVVLFFPAGFLITLFIPGTALIICHFKGAPFTRTMAAVTFAPMALAASVQLVLRMTGSGLH